MFDQLMKNSKNEFIFAFFFLTLLTIIFLPLTPFFLDLFIASSLIFSILILFSALNSKNFLDLSNFPTLFLLFTLFRLVLNIASTKSILMNGQAGDIIDTFARMAVGDSLLIGILIFSLLTIINFVVITKGSSRIAEVKARFALEGLAGKQLAVDADLKSGVITTEEAKFLRLNIIEEANFYGAMDGAAKFVKGDAIAGLLVIFINLLGGIIKGCLLDHLDIYEAVTLYIHLTIGEGLVMLLPALIVSLSAGFLLTKDQSRNIGSPQSLFSQISTHKSIFTTSLIITIFGCLPGLPHLTIFTLGAAGFILSKFIKKKEIENKSLKLKTFEEDKAEKIEKKDLFLIELEIGKSLVSKVDFFQKAIAFSREELKREFGIALPAIQIKDSSICATNSYIFKVKGFSIFSSSMEKCVEQLVLNELFKSVLQKFLHEVLTRSSVLEIIERVKNYDKSMIEEIYPQKLSLGHFFKIFQSLLKEGISLKDPIAIFETLADQLLTGKNAPIDLDELCEHVRQKMSLQLSQTYLNYNNTLHAIVLDSQVEQMMKASLNKNGKLLIRPSTGKKISLELSRLFQENSKKGLRPVILTDREYRAPLKKWIEHFLPEAQVFAYSELPVETDIKTIGRLSTDLLL